MEGKAIETLIFNNFLSLALPNQYVMKRLLLILALFLAGITTAQENYTIGGDTYLLTQQVKAP